MPPTTLVRALVGLKIVRLHKGHIPYAKTVIQKELFETAVFVFNFRQN